MDEKERVGLKNFSQSFKKRVLFILVTFALLAIVIFWGFRAFHLDFNFANTCAMTGVFLAVDFLMLIFVKELDASLFGLFFLLFMGHAIRYFILACIYFVWLPFNFLFDSDTVLPTILDCLGSRTAAILYYLSSFLVPALSFVVLQESNDISDDESNS